MAHTVNNFFIQELHIHQAAPAVDAMEIDEKMSAAAQILLEISKAPPTIQPGKKFLLRDPEDDFGRFFPATVTKVNKEKVSFVWDGFRVKGKPVYTAIERDRLRDRLEYMPAKEVLKTMDSELVSYKIDGVQQGDAFPGYYIPARG